MNENKGKHTAQHSDPDSFTDGPSAGLEAKKCSNKVWQVRVGFKMFYCRPNESAEQGLTNSPTIYFHDTGFSLKILQLLGKDIFCFYGTLWSVLVFTERNYWNKS
jgi:hypothetical protein